MSDLEHVVALIKANKKVEARKQLLSILVEDRNNERAWVYMALCAANREELVASVRHALRVNPESPAALKLAVQHKIPITRPQSTPPAKSSKPSMRDFEPEIADDPYPTQEAHPTQLLPPRQSANRLNVDVQSQFAMPDWTEPKQPSPKSKRWGRLVVFTLVGFLLIVAGALLAIVLLTNKDEPLGANAQTATSISGTNAVILNSQQQRATEIALTLNPPTPTRIPRENAQ